MSMNISRRSFMKGAAASSLAVAASTMLTGCSLPNLGDIFGGLGAKKGSFKVGEKAVNIMLENCQYISYYNQIIPTFKVENGFSSPVKFVAKAQAGSDWQIVPTFTYAGEEQPLTTKVPSENTVQGGETKSIDLIGQATLNQWTGAKLTLTLYRGDVAYADAAPIDFDLTK